MQEGGLGIWFKFVYKHMVSMAILEVVRLPWQLNKNPKKASCKIPLYNR